MRRSSARRSARTRAPGGEGQAVRELADRRRLEVVLRSLEQLADLLTASGHALAEQRPHDDVEHERPADRVEVDLHRPSAQGRPRGSSTAASVRCTIVGIQPLSRRRLNAACTEPRRRRLWSAPSETIIDRSPTTKPSTLNLWPQRNASVGVPNSSRSAVGSPTMAMRTGPAPRPTMGP